MNSAWLKQLLSADDMAERLASRGYTLDVGHLREMSTERSALIARTESIRGEIKAASKDKAAAQSRRDELRALRDEEHRLADDLRRLEDELDDLLAAIPNLPDPDVPLGSTEEDAVELHRWGSTADRPYTVGHHGDLAEALGLIDLGMLRRVTSERGAVYVDLGARLYRALVTFFLDQHRLAGYREIIAPVLISPRTLRNTGQLPKFGEDLYRTEDLFLSPTAEVTLTNLVADEMLDDADLPLRMTAYSECFRREAGSAGSSTRGLIRHNQFGKVELVHICRAEDADAHHQEMLRHAESVLQRLALAYRVIHLARGDMSQAAASCFDLEVWLPGAGEFREVSSISNCRTYQTDRMNARARATGGGRVTLASLNGSGFPIGRLIAAILEQGQRADGGIDIPEALHPYTGFAAISSRGEAIVQT